jgi:UDP-GlcNAc:undecaprenyl-phosphate GlcNAc-1-phosphate transferase
MGSLFLGYFVAVLSTVCTFTSYPQANLVAAAMPLLIMAVPLYDTASVILIRWRRGLSIFKADKNHLSHRLVSLGFSQRDAVLTIYLLTFCCGVGATLADQLDALGTAMILVQVFGFLQLTALLERAGGLAVRKANELPAESEPPSKTPAAPGNGTPPQRE